MDVYLYRIDDYAEYKKQTEKYNALSSAHWGKLGEYKLLTEEQKKEAGRKDEEIAASLGLAKWGEYPGMVKVERDSILYPEHMFKIGYLRSSYNEGGIDQLLRDRLDTSLSDIFGAEGEYEFQPDWQTVRERAIKTLEDWRAFTASTRGKSYRVMVASDNLLTGTGERVDSSAAALKIFREQLEAHKERPADHLSFSNRFGDFFLDQPLRIAAVIPGFRWGNPATYIVYEAKDEDWYTHALEVVIENCEWVLEQPDSQLYWLHWSG